MVEGVVVELMLFGLSFRSDQPGKTSPTFKIYTCPAQSVILWQWNPSLGIFISCFSSSLFNPKSSKSAKLRSKFSFEWLGFECVCFKEKRDFEKVSIGPEFLSGPRKYETNPMIDFDFSFKFIHVKGRNHSFSLPRIIKIFFHLFISNQWCLKNRWLESWRLANWTKGYKRWELFNKLTTFGMIKFDNGLVFLNLAWATSWNSASTNSHCLEK